MFSLQNGWAWQLVSLQNEVNTENSTKWPGIYQTGDSWWIEKFEAISIMFGGHMSMYKNIKTHFVDMFRVTPIRFAFFKCPRIPPQVRTRISTKWHQLSSHVPGYPHKFEQESLQNESMEKWVYNQTLHYTRIASTKWLKPSPFFGQNPARHRMMVYAGHVPSHFVPEISRGIH